MASKNDGGPAFPTVADGGCGPGTGLSMRDYFAGQALQGLLSCSKVDRPDDGWKKGIARVSYEYADAMLAKRAEQQ